MDFWWILGTIQVSDGYIFANIPYRDGSPLTVVIYDITVAIGGIDIL